MGFLTSLLTSVLAATLYATLVHAHPGEATCPKASYCFVIDESDSISASEFYDLQIGAQRFIEHLMVHATGSYYSAVSFSTTSNVIQSPTMDGDLAMASITSSTQAGGDTQVSAGLNGCAKLLQGEPGPQFVFLLTNGEATSTGQAVADDMKDDGIKIAVVAVGTEPADTSLLGIATEGHYFEVEKFAYLPDDTTSILHDICDANKPGEPLCKGVCQKANLCYAVDESGSIKKSDFERQANVLVGLTSTFDALAPNSMYSVAGFADVSEVVQSATFDADMVMDSLRDNKRSKGQTASGAGIMGCYNLIKHLNGPKIIVLVTDGEDTRDPKGVDVEEEVKDSGVKIVSVGITKNINAPELLEIASPNDKSGEKYYTSVASYKVFSEAIGSIVRDMCHASITYKKKEEPRCGYAWCARCGDTLECYADNDDAVLDKRVCSAIRAPGFCTGKNRNKCKEKCPKGVVCYEGSMIGPREVAPQCQTMEKPPATMFPKHFTKIRACEDEDGFYSHECAKKKCLSDDPQCWPEENM